jgi:hypothetical protein
MWEKALGLGLGLGLGLELGLGLGLGLGASIHACMWKKAPWRQRPSSALSCGDSSKPCAQNSPGEGWG